MTSRERLAATLRHEATDRVCVDFGAGFQTGLGAGAVHRLREALFGKSSQPVKVVESYQMLGEMDEELRRALGLDVVGVHGSGTMFGFKNEGWKPFTMFDGTPVLVPGRFNVTPAEDGGWMMHPEGDTSVPPSAWMPKDTFFFDSVNRQGALDEAALDPADNCEEMEVVSDAEVAHFTQLARHYHEQTDYGIYMTLPGTAFGDIALVPAPWMKHPKGIRSVEDWYMATAMRRDYVQKVFEVQCECALKSIEKLAAAVGERAQVVFVSGTDFGTQTGQFCSVKTYRELYKPFHKAVNDLIHKLTPWKTFIHSCGAVAPFIAEFIDAGFDVLNPVQCSATGMDPRWLKREFGRQIVFWGGGVDTQKTLPFGTPEEVYREARERIDIFAEGGGFVFNSIHNVQSNVPTENMLALFRAIKDSR
ncbi:MAG: methyltransferase [Verrucomicrobia bacterium]|nr:methyltransferase [Verrucomicrobiota bacterium]